MFQLIQRLTILSTSTSQVFIVFLHGKIDIALTLTLIFDIADVVFVTFVGRVFFTFVDTLFMALINSSTKSSPTLSK